MRAEAVPIGRRRRSGSRRRNGDPSEAAADSNNPAAWRAYRVALWSVVPGFGLLLGPVAMVFGGLAVRGAGDDLSACNRAKAAILFGAGSTAYAMAGGRADVSWMDRLGFAFPFRRRLVIRPPRRWSMGRVGSVAVLALLVSSCAPTVQERIQDYNDLGIQHYQKGEYDRAREDFQAGLNLRPNDFTLLYNLGQCYDHLGQADQRRADLSLLSATGA